MNEPYHNGNYETLLQAARNNTYENPLMWFLIRDGDYSVTFHRRRIPSLIEVTIPNLDVGIDGSDSKCLEDILNTSAIDSIGYLPRHLVVMGDYTDDDRAYIINEAIRCITEVNNHNSM